YAFERLLSICDDGIQARQLCYFDRPLGERIAALSRCACSGCSPVGQTPFPLFAKWQGEKLSERELTFVAMGLVVGRLAQFLHNPVDLVAKKFGAARGRMADAVCVHIKFFQLGGSDFSQRDDLIAG